MKIYSLLVKHQAKKMYLGMEVYFRAFLTLALDGGEWSFSRPGHFSPRKRAHRTSE
jgi:hypothetical protein